MKLRRHTVKRGRIEIIPMIDTILILLIFYMTFSTFTKREKRIDAKLPTVSTAVPPTQVPLDVTLHINDRDHILVNGVNTYDLLSLRDAMTQLAAIGQEATVVIEAEPNTRYQDVISTLDVCAQAHMMKIAFRPLADIVASAK
jgi:biopolymer transport protein ExbD